MPCYHPIPAYQVALGAPVRLHPPVGTANLQLPCGSCLGCKAMRAVEWSRRCMHEAGLWDVNSFVTLTYDAFHFPPNGHLVPQDLTNFIKRLRKDVNGSCSGAYSGGGVGIRYFACGEYGGESGRPHFHALFFNLGFRDARRVGADLYESPTLSRLWPFGMHRIGAVTARSACYVAKYSMKRSGSGRDDCDGDGVWRPAPFLRMSLKPGIGAGWLKSYSRSLAHGYLVSDGSRGRIPRAYLKRLEVSDPHYAEAVKFAAYRYGVSSRADGSDPARLEAGERIHARRLELSDRRSL